MTHGRVMVNTILWARFNKGLWLVFLYKSSLYKIMISYLGLLNGRNGSKSLWGYILQESHHSHFHYTKCIHFVHECDILSIGVSLSYNMVMTISHISWTVHFGFIFSCGSLATCAWLFNFHFLATCNLHAILFFALFVGASRLLPEKWNGGV